MKLPVLTVFVVLVGCIHAPTQRPGVLAAAPADPMLVATCRSERNWHNAWTILGGAAGGAAGVAGAAESVPTTNAGKLAVGLVSLGVGVASIVFGAASGITAADYSDNKCDSVLQ
jgi:hypothetical protein